MLATSATANHLRCQHRMLMCSLNHSPSLNHTNHSSDSPHPDKRSAQRFSITAVRAIDG